MRDTRTDEDLLARLKAGDERALEQVAAQYGARIYQLAFRYLRNREDAEEVVQDVLYKVHRKVRDFRGDAALASWIYRITYNTAISRLRTARYQRAQAEDDLAAPAGEQSPRGQRDIPDWSSLGDEQVLRAELRTRVLRAVRGLPAIYRAPVLLRDIQGMSADEASERLHVKNQTLKSRLHRGRLILRRELADFAGGLPLHHAQAA